MKTISVRDLLLLPELSHLNEFSLIDPNNDELVKTYLHELGFDLAQPVEYIPCKHRTLQGKVVVSYLLSGELNMSEEFLSSSFATQEDREFAREFREIESGMRLQEEHEEEECHAFVSERKKRESALPFDQLESDSSAIEEIIASLAESLLSLRGDPFKSNGSRKTMDEVHLPDVPAKVRKK